MPPTGFPSHRKHFTRHALFSTMSLPLQPSPRVICKGFKRQQRCSLGGLVYSLCNLSRIHGQSSRCHKISVLSFPGQNGQVMDHCWSQTQGCQEGLPSDCTVTGDGRCRDDSKQTKNKAGQCSMSAVKHIGICSAAKGETAVLRTLKKRFVTGA